MRISDSKARIQFITESLLIAAEAVAHLQTETARYTDVKGYLSEADLSVDHILSDAINRRFPDESILSEERNNDEAIGNNGTWIMDPICGTTNYVRGIPFYVHSLCFANADGVQVAGIYHAATNEMFLADRNETTLNGKPVRVSHTRFLSQAIIAVNCNQSARNPNESVLKSLAEKLAPPVTRRLRILESANLELAYVACGRLDGYVNPDDKVWDIAAGSLMIASAGGETRMYHGDIRHFPSCRGVVASNPHIDYHLRSLVLPQKRSGDARSV